MRPRGLPWLSVRATKVRRGRHTSPIQPNRPRGSSLPTPGRVRVRPAGNNLSGHLVACRGLVLLDGGVEVAELEAGVFGGEVPVDLALAGVGRLLPRGEFGVEDVE